MLFKYLLILVLPPILVTLLVPNSLGIVIKSCVIVVVCQFGKKESIVATIFGLDRGRDWLCNDCRAKLMAAVSPELPTMAQVAYDTELHLPTIQLTTVSPELPTMAQVANDKELQLPTIQLTTVSPELPLYRLAGLS